MSMSGRDYLTALAIIAELADVNRFPTTWKLISYAGISPTHRDSSQKIRRGLGEDEAGFKVAAVRDR